MPETTNASQHRGPQQSGQTTPQGESAEPLSRPKSTSSARRDVSARRDASVRRDGEIDTRTRLLEAAGPVFAAHGFDGATVREICSAAEVNVALVGYYFGDKLGLYREVIRGVRDSRERRFPTPNNDAGDPRRTLYRIVRTLLSRMLACDESGWETQLLMREMHRPTPVFESMVGEFFRPQFDRLVATIRDLTGTSVPKHRLEQMALSVVGQCLYYRIGGGIVQVLIPPRELEEHFDIDSLSRHITSVMLAATQGGTATRQYEELDQWLSEH